jgi:hypothetical protein
MNQTEREYRDQTIATLGAWSKDVLAKHNDWCIFNALCSAGENAADAGIELADYRTELEWAAMLLDDSANCHCDDAPAGYSDSITTQDPAGLDVQAVTAKGNVYQVVQYVDPYPGRKGSERVSEDCWKCDGTGVVSWGNVTVQHRGREDRWCFTCGGSGQRSRLVSSARSTAKAQAKAATQANAEAADWQAEAPAREAAERQAQAEAERLEAERVAALPKGFLGEPGDRLRDLAATVTKVRTYESSNYMTGRPEPRCVLAFDVAGKVAVWFTDWSQDLEEGQRVTLTGTVKDHNNHQGTDQTVLTRCIIKEG